MSTYAPAGGLPRAREERRYGGARQRERLGSRSRYRVAVAMPFDPIARAAETWETRFGDSAAMAAVTAIMRVQQILLAQLDTLLRPHGLTFARYEALVLLSFSREGELPMRIIGERLMVHPTSVTNTI